MRERSKADFLIVGAGIAGLRAAIELARAGEVVIFAKDDPKASHAQYLQGGIAAAFGEEDDVGLHFQETLRAGDGLCREEAVRALVEEGPRQIEQLMDWGLRFERNGARRAVNQRGLRVLRAAGKSTGGAILKALRHKAKSLKNIHFRPRRFAVDLLVEGHRVKGVSYVDPATHQLRAMEASAVLLATGGLGSVYLDTTNSPGATGDGIAMAYSAGAQLRDVEFIQFHPTVLCVKGRPRFVLSEVLRGEGALLRDLMLDRFMPRYHEAAEVAPRDVVARAMVMEIHKTRSDFVYLDLTHLDAEHIKKRFSAIYSACLEFNIDITTDLIPVRPAAHYAMGGVATDLQGASTLRGLYAAGETAATGLHGANRLANNSLLEALVFGARAGQAMASGRAAKLKTAKARAAQTVEAAAVNSGPSSRPLAPDKLVEEVRSTLEKQVGIIRTGKGLEAAVRHLDSLWLAETRARDRSYYEARNMLEVGRQIARSALARRESRGAHYRSDFPLKQQDGQPHHSLVCKDSSVLFE